MWLGLYDNKVDNCYIGDNGIVHLTKSKWAHL